MQYLGCVLHLVVFWTFDRRLYISSDYWGSYPSGAVFLVRVGVREGLGWEGEGERSGSLIELFTILSFDMIGVACNHTCWSNQEIKFMLHLLFSLQSEISLVHWFSWSFLRDFLAAELANLLVSFRSVLRPLEPDHIMASSPAPISLSPPITCISLQTSLQGLQVCCDYEILPSRGSWITFGTLSKYCLSARRET